MAQQGQLISDTPDSTDNGVNTTPQLDIPANNGVLIHEDFANDGNIQDTPNNPGIDPNEQIQETHDLQDEEQEQEEASETIDDHTEDDNEIDNASQHGSEPSSEDNHQSVSENGVSASATNVMTRARAAAQRLQLEAEAEILRKTQELEREEQRIQQMKQQLELELKLAAARAAEMSLSDQPVSRGDNNQHTDGSEVTIHQIQHDQTPRRNAPQPTQQVPTSRQPAPQPAQQTRRQPTPQVPQPTRPGSHVHQPRPQVTTPSYQPAPQMHMQPPSVSHTPQMQQIMYPATPQSPQMTYLPTEGLQQGNMHVQQEIWRQQRELIDVMKSPPVVIKTFDGSPIHYYPFIKSFKENVEKVVIDSASRLTRLNSYTTGKANKLIQSCMILPPDQGYIKALSLLQDRFGNPFVISQAWVTKITAGSNIKQGDNHALQDYADDLRICTETLKAIDYLFEMSNQSTLLQIIARLPAYLQNRWRKEATNIKMNRSRRPTLDDIVRFVELAAEEANDPIFGYSSSKTAPPPAHAHSEQKPERKNARHSTFNATNKTPQCVICGENHIVHKCETFKAMKVSERCDIVKEKGLCFNCLRPGHLSGDCRSDGRCRADNCGRKHSTWLHSNATRSNENSSSSTPASNNISNTAPQVVKSSYIAEPSMMGTKTALPILPVKVRKPGDIASVTTFALLDQGSTASFASQKLINDLNVKGKNCSISLSTLEKQDSTFNTQIVSLEVMDYYETTTIKLPSVFTKDILPIDIENVASRQDAQKFPHLQDINIPQVDCKEVGLLIGNDSVESLVPLEIIKAEHNNNLPYAQRTKLGWSISGPLPGENQGSMTACFVQANNLTGDQDRLHGDMEQMWKLESSGLYDEQTCMSVNDKKVIKIWDETTIHNDGHFSVKIPLKDADEAIPNNIDMAKQRLASLGKRLIKDDKLKQDYIDGMTKLIEDGFAVKVNEHEADEGNIIYLPHHPVISESKDKIRIVFDCAAKYMGRSLNDRVHQGPDLNNKLLGVLLRFREENIAFMSDISAMFHQIKVPPGDQDLLRFLWWPSGDTTREPDTYRLTVTLFGGKWSPSAATYALHKTVDMFGDGYSEITRSTIHNNFYVDDCLKSVKGVEEATLLCRELKQLLAEGGFNLTKWISNHDDVTSQIPKDDLAKSVTRREMGEPLSDKALGIHWQVEEDTFSFSTKSISNKPATKRGILSTLSSLYDPYGAASPFILRARRLVQQLCTLKMGWDDPIPITHKIEWGKWVHQLAQMKYVTFPRCLKPLGFGDATVTQLHHFSDASSWAYGACSYLRLVNDKGEISSRLIMARSRLAPIKAVTIPRLELMAATLAARQDQTLRTEMDMPINQSFFWTDSEIVLKYIKNEDRRYHTFVANRVTLIRELTNPSAWNHISTHQNVADDCSRGLEPAQLNTPRWQTGPDFLMLPQTDWPPDSQTLFTLEDNDPEVKAVTQKVFVAKKTEPHGLDRLMSSTTDWTKLKTSLAWILAIKDKLSGRGPAIKVLNASHLHRAETEMIKYMQSKEWGDGVNDATKLPTSLSSLQPVIIDGVVRVGGRIKNAPVEFERKHPAILPNVPIVEGLLRLIHETSGHSGREYILSVMRERFWMVNGRRMIKGMLHRCIRCKRREPKACQQEMADLPATRVTPDKPVFYYTGCDYFGPFTVKRGRGRDKRYGCLFTCLTTRAIHIEVAQDLTTDSYINCLNRFIARRGKCAVMYSDNGRNFVGAERALAASIQEWNQGSIHHKLNQEGIEWRFSTPAASHHGGCWERSIRSVRRVLAGLTQEQILTEDALHTLLCIVEGILNNRPLTNISSDPQDCEPLTPNHLMIFRPAHFVPGLFDKNDNYSRNRWRQVQYMADLFWRRWIREYLPELQRRAKWTSPQRDLQPGDLVLVMDNQLARNEWCMGRIISCHRGTDDRVRTVTVKTKQGKTTRPVTKICLLEPVKVDLVMEE